MIEAGVPDFVSQSWWGVFAPAGTPPAVLRRLGDTVYSIIPEPQSKERYAVLGVEPLNLTPPRMMELVRAELASYGKIIKEVGITAQ